MINILIVEDELPISNLISVNLTESGYHCHVANDGMTAADMIEQNRYDLILLDIMLPKVSGYEPVSYTHLDVYKRQVYPSDYASYDQLLENYKKVQAFFA